MNQLIINADDFGLCESVNIGILECFYSGMVTDFSFMINKNEFERSHQLLAQYGITEIGFHLNLTVGSSVSSKNSSLTDKSGSFFGFKKFILKIVQQKISPGDIYSEIKAQLTLLMSMGYSITHIDSHTHIHLLPVIFRNIIQLNRELALNVPIRIPLERGVNAFNLSRLNVMRVLILNLLSRYSIFQTGYQAKTRWIGGDFFNNQNPEKAFASVVQEIKRAQSSLFEMAVHPGYPSKQIGLYDSYNEQRQRELIFLKNRQNLRFASEFKLRNFQAFSNNSDRAY